jgi:prepilin-type N-terminal cleavage/methylation domain-containing protein
MATKTLRHEVFLIYYFLGVFVPLRLLFIRVKIMKKAECRIPGFTLAELMIVLVIISIIAAIAVPMYSSAAGVQLKTAANVIASDLEYAKSMAISTGQTYQVVFDTAAESYRIKNSAGAVITHPVHIGANYIVNFASDSRLNKVDIVSTTFGAGGTIKFDYLGTPFNGAGVSLSNGSVVLRAEGRTMTVKIEPVTGYITIE